MNPTSHLANTEAQLADILSLLHVFKLHDTQQPTNLGIELTPRGAFVQVAGIWWSVWDNGGEIGIERLNSGELPRMVPLWGFGAYLNAITVAMRVAAVLRGEEIDFEANMSNEDQETLVGLEGTLGQIGY